MKKSIKGLFAGLLMLGAAGSLVACAKPEEPKPDPKPPVVEPGDEDQKPDPKPETLKDITATSEVELSLPVLDEEGNPQMGPQGPMTQKVKFDVVLEGKGATKKFKITLTPQDENFEERSLNGTYEFAEGVGYTFTMSGSNSKFYTIYDEEAKKHNLTVEGKLGDYGSHTIKLSFEDKDFVVVPEKQFLSQVVFGGGYFSKDGVVLENADKTEKGVGFGLKIHADGTFTFDNNHIVELKQTGTYTFNKTTKEFEFKLKDADKTTDITAKSTFKDGVFSVDFKFNYTNAKNQLIELPVTLEYNSNYYGGHGLSGVSYPMGAEFLITLTLNNDGTAFIDGTPTEPIKGALAGMNLFKNFDKKGTWTYNAETKQYTITYKDMVMGSNGQPQMGEDGQPIYKESSFTTEYDETTKLYTLKGFKLGAAETVLVGKDFGKDFNPSH